MAILGIHCRRRAIGCTRFFKTHPSFFSLLGRWILGMRRILFLRCLLHFLKCSVCFSSSTTALFNEPLPKGNRGAKNNLTTYFSEQFQQNNTFDSGPVPHHSGMYGTYHDLLKTSQRSFYQQNKGKICQLLPGDHYIVKKALLKNHFVCESIRK